MVKFEGLTMLTKRKRLRRKEKSVRVPCKIGRRGTFSLMMSSVVREERPTTRMLFARKDEISDELILDKMLRSLLTKYRAIGFNQKMLDTKNHPTLGLPLRSL